MIADLHANEVCDWDDQVAFRSTSVSRGPRELTARDRRATRARYRRAGKAAASFNGAHRRREKRNYL